MSNDVKHAALPYPVKGARFTLPLLYLDADGDPTDPTTPDTERSIDGAAFADCTEEVTTVSTGNGYITLTGDELNGSMVMIQGKAASGPKTSCAVLLPRVLPVLRSGTAQAGASGTITLDSGASSVNDIYNGCIVKTTGGTGGGGGSGSQNNQARVITDYDGSTKVATISPNWETAPSSDTTFEILLTEMSIVKMSDLVRLGGSEQSVTDLKDFADTGYDPSTHKVEGVKTADNLTNAPTAGDFTATMKSSITAAVPSVSQIQAELEENGASLLDTINDKLGTPVGASFSADIADIESKVDDLEGRLTAARAGYLDSLNGHVAQSGDAFARLGAPSGVSVSADIATIVSYIDTEIAAILAAVDTEIAAIKNKTDNLPASPAAVGSAMTLADDAITAAKFDESTAFPLKQADSSTTQLARVGADGDTLETLSDQLDAVPTDAENAAAVWASTVEGLHTALHVARILLSFVAGITADAPDAPKFKDQANTKNRISMIVDAYGNRSNVVVDGT